MKTILITGSKGCLGKELVKVFTQHNYYVITHGKEGDVEVYGDLRNRNTINKLIRVSERKNLDVFVNNASMSGPSLPLEYITDEQINDILSVNLIAPIKITKGIYSFFIKRGYGSIININSSLVFRAEFQRSIYSSSKNGLLGFSLGLRKEAKEKGINIIDFYLNEKKDYDGIAEDIYNELKKSESR